MATSILQILQIVLLSSIITGQNYNSFQIILPQLNTKNDTYPVYEGESVMVCVQARATSTEVKATVKGTTLPMALSAIGKIDYKPKEFTLTFMKLSANQTECSEISIIQDGLDEPTEFFELMLSIDNGNNVIDRKKVSISACRNGDILLRESPRETFSIVEYCTKWNSDHHYWVTLCDGENRWTAEDATVACNQANMYSGSLAGNFYIGEKMRNGLTGWFDCYGNESKLDECNNTDSKHVQGGSCYPVLVDCSSGSSSGGTNVAAAVSTPLVLLVVGAGVCAAVIVVLYLWRKRKLQQKRFASCQVQSTNHTSLRKRQTSSQEPPAHVFHSSGDRVDNTNTDEIPNRNCLEPDVEYSAPFTQPDRKCLVIPPGPTKHGTTSKHPTSAVPQPSKHNISATQRALCDEEHYEGCDMAQLKVGVFTRRPAGGHPEIMAEYSELEQSSYSKLQDK